MLTNYLKIALRNISRNKGFSFINIAGLAMGMAATLLIVQYVAFERSYDRFHEKADRIFRVTAERYERGVLSTEWAGGPFAVGNHLKSAFDEVDEYTKVYMRDKLLLEVNNRKYRVDKGAFATPSFFSVFSYSLLTGDPRTALAEPNTGVISASLAQRLFGTNNPVGQVITIEREFPIRVTGVYQDFPKNSHLAADYLMSFSTFQRIVNPKNEPDKNFDNAWDWDGCLTYVVLKEGANPARLAAKLPAWLATLDQRDPKTNSGLMLHLQALPDIHLYSHLMFEAGANGDGNSVYVLLCVAFFIIAIAWINYINLATARAVGRAREVGVRKAIGSYRRQLISQFLMESALLNFIAVLVAFGLILLALPLFNHFTDQELTYSFVRSGRFWLGLGAMYTAGTLLSGGYPAFVLSGFNPVSVLKNGVSAFREGVILRKSLVVIQFSASVFLLVGTITVFRQLQFMRAQSLGIDIGQTLVLNRPMNDSTRISQTRAFKDYLLRQSAIRQVAVSGSIPGEKVEFNAGGIRLESAPQDEGKQYRVIGVDYDFVDAFGMKLIAGRNFDAGLGEKGAVVFNKTGIRQLGFSDPEKALGKKIDFWGDILTIVGVVDDFHQQSLREAYEPLILRLDPGVNGSISIKLADKDPTQAIAVARDAWSRFFPTDPFEYSFLDERYDKQYRADEQFGQVFGFFTLMALLVACLGLLGLATFTAQQRTKEIGVRKVLGASVGSIISLLSVDLLRLVLVAIVIASPVAWYAMHQWLQGFAYKIDIEWWVFAVAGLLALAIAFLTVSFQSLKAALMNPVKSLRSE
ncbi:ABC transporter permease [Spirosoma sordidisoli]|uniref:FtsX-like permease family protein n=1 Tax=Spirosoma sordidisoli TaxID=2502893 RepID=A0A4Q2UM89_9BACT|nr:ABC transporter permease [Spirosoma sordidisoli]RYC68841.1 FtsX-like permease family protein [Spirosoma sordidisoli]